MQIKKETTVADVVSKNLGSDHIFSKYNIDFCCGGGDTLEKACKESGVEFEVLKAEIESINNKISYQIKVRLFFYNKFWIYYFNNFTHKWSRFLNKRSTCT